MERALTALGATVHTATTDDEGSLGDRFFCHQDRGLKKQRILIIRVVDSGQSAASLAR